jgi:hypothetical protein
MIQAGEEYAREQDADAVFAARRQLDDWERENIFDPEKGAVTKRGKDAFGLGQELSQSFDEFQGKVASGLSTDRQRRAFAEVSASRRSQVADWAGRHELKQVEAYKVGQYQADISSMADRAAAMPDQAAVEIGLMSTRIKGFMQAQGASKEEIDAEIKANASKAHAGVMASMLNAGRTEDAAKYLATQKLAGTMTADTVLRAEAAMKETVARSRAQTFADEAFASGMSAEEAIKAARKKFSGVDEDAAVNEIKTRDAERVTLQTRAQKDAADTAWKVITNGGGRKQISPDLWNRLGGEEQRQINDYLEQKWRRAKSDAEGTGNDVTPDRLRNYISLVDMAANEPAKFAELDLARYEPQLTKQHMEKLIGLRAGINTKDAKAVAIGTVANSAINMLPLDSAGIKMSGQNRSKKEVELADMFKLRLLESIEEAAKSGPVDQTKAKAIGMDLLREGIEQGSDGWFSGPTKRRQFEIETERLGGVRKDYVSKQFNDIPQEDRRGLIEALAKRKNLPRSIYGDRDYILSAEDKAEIERRYQLGIERGVFK